MDTLSFVWENRLVLIPVLNVLGWFIKNTRLIPDRFIPIVLLLIGIILSVCIECRFTADAVIQGIFAAGAAVMGNQIQKQIKKDY